MDAGFTLVEALFAGLLTMLIGLPCYAILRTNLSALDLVVSRTQQAEQARETFRLLGDGTASFGTGVNARGFTMVEGLHSRSALPTNWKLRSTTATGQFVLPDGNLQASGDLVGPVTIACQGAGIPVPDCTGAETRTIQGWLGSDPVLAQPTANSIQFPASVSISVTNPYRAARSIASPAGAAQGPGITETFRNQFGTMVEASP